MRGDRTPDLLVTDVLEVVGDVRERPTYLFRPARWATPLLLTIIIPREPDTAFCFCHDVRKRDYDWLTREPAAPPEGVDCAIMERNDFVFVKEDQGSLTAASLCVTRASTFCQPRE